MSRFFGVFVLTCSLALVGSGAAFAQQPTAPGDDISDIKVSVGKACPFEYVGYTKKTKAGVVRCIPTGGVTADVVPSNVKSIDQWLSANDLLNREIPGKWEFISVLDPDSPFVALMENDGEMYLMDELHKCRLSATNPATVGLQWPRSAGRVPTRGPIKVILIPVASEEEPNMYHGFGTWLESLHPAGSGLNHLEYADLLQRAQSYGNSWFDFTVLPSIVTLDQTIADYGIQRENENRSTGFNQFMADVVTAADDVVDFSDYDAFIAMPPPGTVGYSPAWARSPGSGVMADGVEMTNGTTLGDESLYRTQAEVLVHENGHLSGLPDLYDFAPAIYRHAGSFTQMSDPYQFRGSSGYERWLLRWIDDSRVRCVDLKRKESTQIVFDSLSEAALPASDKELRTLLAVIPTSSSTGVVLEYRTRKGLDATLPEAGLHVYTIDVNVSSMSGPLVSHRDDADTYGPAADPDDRADVYSRGVDAVNSIKESLLRPGDSLVIDGYRITVPQDQVSFSNRPTFPVRRSGSLAVEVARVP